MHVHLPYFIFYVAILSLKYFYIFIFFYPYTSIPLNHLNEHRILTKNESRNYQYWR